MPTNCPAHFPSADFVPSYPKPADGIPQKENRVEVMEFLACDIYENGMTDRVNAANDAAAAYYEKQNVK